MTDEEEKKKTTWKRISSGFPKHTKKKKQLFCCLFSLTPLPVDRQQWTSASAYWREMTRDEDEWRSSLRDKSFTSLSSVSLSSSLSVCISPSLSFLAAYDDVTRLLNRYMRPSFTHQAVCNRTIPQFIFHIIVFPFLACHGGLALWASWRRGWDRRADRRKVEGCWASLRGCLAL